MMLLEVVNWKPFKSWFPKGDNDGFETAALEVPWWVSIVFLSVSDMKETSPAVVGIHSSCCLKFYAWSHVTSALAQEYG